MNDKTYDILKNWVLPLLTGGATFIITLGELWGIPYSKEVAGTMTALATLISFVLNQSSKAFFKDKEIVEVDVNNKDVDING